MKKVEMQEEELGQLAENLKSKFSAGKYGLVCDWCKTILAINPTYVLGWRLLGLSLLKTGKITDSLEAMKRVIELEPGDAASHSNIGLIFKILGRYKESESSYLQAIRLKPDSAEPYSNLANLLFELNRFPEAEAACRTAIRLNPNFVQAHINMGNLLAESKFIDKAINHFCIALRLDPQCPEALANLGVVEAKMGMVPQAADSLLKATLLKPDYAEAHNNLGNVLFDLGRLSEAEASYRTAISLKPDFGEAYSNLGNAFKRMFRLVDARQSYQEAIRLKPDFCQAYINFGNVLQEYTDFPGAEAMYRHALRLNPELMEAYSNLLFLVNYDPRRSESEIFDEYHKFGEFVSARYSKSFKHKDDRFVKDRKIRIGYSSADFKGHACRFFIEPLLRHHDKEKFELYAYSNVRVADSHTERIKQYFDYWIDVFALSDEHMARRIYDDGIDILVDFSGHTEGNRLLVFAMRPAPIQVTYPAGTGYTSGLKEIDYFLGNKYVTPVGCDRFYSEKVWRLPGVLSCYDPSSDAFPTENSLPFLKNGFITFGCLARPVRMNDEVLLSWKEILTRVPGSRLRLDQKIFSDLQTKNIFLSKMKLLGMSIEQIDLVNSQPHWIGYHEIDISLDCFPHNAGTTTLESLWMGVPVITKTSSLSIGRIGDSVLSQLGLEEWVAKTREEYIEKAVSLSGQIQKLTFMRKSLRSSIKQSALMKYEIFTKEIERAFQEMIELDLR
jgi:protein O-GlcNAc transferase